jgi:hypothetical protein
LPIQERKNLIKEIENKLNTRILAIILGDRQNMETRIAPDILPLISGHLTSFGKVKEISLFIYTIGGDSIAGWSLVNLVRQYCEKLIVLIPFRVLSCGTLIALGADEIFMGRHGILSPIDPSVASPFNPPAPGTEKTGQISLLPVSVEDMIGFLELARKEIGIKSEESMVNVLNILANKIHPLALGAVYRAREQNSSLAIRLLSSHLDKEDVINKIVEQLTEKLPTHNYLIGRLEAKEIGLDIKEPSDEIDLLMWKLYKEYEKWLRLTNPVSSILDLGIEDNKIIRYERAVVECLNNDTLDQYIFITDKELKKVNVPPSGTEQILERIIYQGWIEARENKEVS